MKVAKHWPSAFEQFEDAIDQLFDDILIQRWRERPTGFASEAVISERPDAYEVQIATGGADPNTLDVEVTEHRLAIRATGPGGLRIERSFSFETAIDRDAVNAKWTERKLIVTLPKKRAEKQNV